MKTSDYIDALRVRLGLKSDGGVARSLGVSRQRLSNWRTGVSEMDPDVLPKAAELLGIDPAVIVADIAAARAKTGFERSAYERLAGLARAAALGGAVTITSACQPHQMSEKSELIQTVTLVGHIKCG